MEIYKIVHEWNIRPNHFWDDIIVIPNEYDSNDEIIRLEYYYNYKKQEFEYLSLFYINEIDGGHMYRSISGKIQMELTLIIEEHLEMPLLNFV
jgi:hypothetical protein